MQCFSPAKRRMVLDFVLFLTVAIVIIISHVTPPPYPRVTCDDPSIRRPYQTSTVSQIGLLIMAWPVPVAMMIVFEWLVPPVGDEYSRVRQALRRTWHYSADLGTGVFFVLFLTEVTKTIVGEARPLFWSVCAPNVTAEQCLQPYVSVSWRDCTNPFGFNKRSIVNSLKSFPSGHASLSVCSSVIMIVYIKQRLWNSYSKLLAPWLQLLWITWMVICCQSRVWDNMHHWWDVLAGGLLGVVGALFTVHYLSNWFIREEDVTSPKANNSGRNSDGRDGGISRLMFGTIQINNDNDRSPVNRNVADIRDTP